MKYNFSANFLKILSPATNFGQAWETLCFKLLQAEYSNNSLIRLKPPDKGIDIYSQTNKDAYQCKSSEIGIYGNINPADCISSIKTAVKVKHNIEWKKYFIATNSNFTGNGFEKLQEYLKANNLENIEQLGPQFWSDLCEKHYDKVADLLDYRFLVTEQEVIEAFKKARYFDKYIEQYRNEIEKHDYKVNVKNNRTPIELKIPFSPDLTIKNLLDVVKTLLNIDLKRNNYYDTQTSASPSLSILFKENKQGFNQKIKDVVNDKNPEFELWITIIWRDETKKTDNDINIRSYTECLMLKNINRNTISQDSRRKLTINRTENILQTMMWEGIDNINKLRPYNNV